MVLVCFFLHDNYDWQLIKIIQSSARGNAKDNIKCIEIMMAHK